MRYLHTMIRVRDLPAAVHFFCEGLGLTEVRRRDYEQGRFTLVYLGEHGEGDSLAQWVQHWEPLPSGTFEAQPYEVDEAAPAIDWQSGDQLVFRYAAMNTTTPEAFIPNGDGPFSHGRIPSIALPP